MGPAFITLFPLLCFSPFFWRQQQELLAAYSTEGPLSSSRGVSPSPHKSRPTALLAAPPLPPPHTNLLGDNVCQRGHMIAFFCMLNDHFRINPFLYKKKEVPENINKLWNNCPQKAWISRWFPILRTQQGDCTRATCAVGEGGREHLLTHAQNSKKPAASVRSLRSVGKPR